jgi:hypothetical protein
MFRRHSHDGYFFHSYTSRLPSARTGASGPIPAVSRSRASRRREWGVIDEGERWRGVFSPFVPQTHLRRKPQPGMKRRPPCATWTVTLDAKNAYRRETD